MYDMYIQYMYGVQYVHQHLRGSKKSLEHSRIHAVILTTLFSLFLILDKQNKQNAPTIH